MMEETGNLGKLMIIRDVFVYHAVKLPALFQGNLIKLIMPLEL